MVTSVILYSVANYYFHFNDRRQEREKKRLESGKKGKGAKKKKVAKKGPRGKQDTVDTSKDSEIAKKMAFDRVAKNKDASGVKAKRKAALEQLRKDRADAADKNEDEESDLDYGDDNDDESDGDEEYYEEVKPWQKKKRATRLSTLTDDDEDASGDDRDDGKKRTHKVFVEADASDYSKVTVPRRRLARWCNEPFFEQAVMDFYVRVAIGRDKTTLRPCYRLCKIVGIVSKEQQYTIDDQTNQYAKPGKVPTKPVSNFEYIFEKIVLQ